MPSRLVTLYGNTGSWQPVANPRPRLKGESSLTIRGTTASLLWRGVDAVGIRAWAIFKRDGAWMLTAKLTHINAYRSRQRPLVFTAPRRGGFWQWPLETLELGATELRARLGPPVQ